MLHQPAGFHALVLGIRVPVNVPQLFQRRVRIGLVPDETDGFPLQQEFALVPLTLAPHDGNVGAAGLHLPHALPAVLTVDLQLDLRVVGGVLRQHFRQAVGGVINGSSDAQRTADDTAAFLQPLPQVLKILGWCAGTSLVPPPRRVSGSRRACCAGTGWHPVRTPGSVALAQVGCAR